VLSQTHTAASRSAARSTVHSSVRAGSPFASSVTRRRFDDDALTPPGIPDFTKERRQRNTAKYRPRIEGLSLTAWLREAMKR